MAGSTPKLVLPYPTGTDRVADGDNAMQALAERLEARLPWGCLGMAISLNAQSITSTAEHVIAGLSVNFNQVIGRRYHIYARGCFISGTPIPYGYSFSIWLSGVAVQYSEATVQAPPGLGTGLYVDTIIESGANIAGQVVTLRGQMTSSGGNCAFYAANNRPAHLVVEDIGPVVTT